MALETIRPREDVAGVVPMHMRLLLFWLAMAVGCLIICEENQHGMSREREREVDVDACEALRVLHI